MIIYEYISRYEALEICMNQAVYTYAYDTIEVK